MGVGKKWTRISHLFPRRENERFYITLTGKIKRGKIISAFYLLPTEPRALPLSEDHKKNQPEENTAMKF